MRILQLAQWYSPIIGGEEGHVRALSTGLTRRGHQVSVATLRQSGAAQDEDDSGIRVHRLPGTLQRLSGLFADSDRRSAPPFPDPETVAALVAILRRERPHIVHAHNWMVGSWLPVQPMSSSRLVVTLHDYSLVCAKKNLLRDGRQCPGPSLGRCLPCAGKHYGHAKGAVTVIGTAANRVALRAMVDMYVPVSDAVRDGVGLAADDPRVRVIPNFLREQAAMPDDESANWTRQLPDEPFILYAGSFAQQKGVGTLLAAHAAMRNRVPLVLIGYPAADAAPEVEAPPSGVDIHVNWPAGAVMAAMRRSAAVVVPSLWREPSPTVVLEAMSVGRPLVASMVGGIPELTGNDAALLVPPGDGEALRSAMDAVVSDLSLADRIGRAGQDRSSGFTSDVIVPRIEALYLELIADRQQPHARRKR